MIALLVLLWGCGGEPSFERDIRPIVYLRCVDCHLPDDPQAELDLLTDPYGSLVGQPSTQSPLAMVEPGDSLYSYLFHKLNGSQMLANGSGTTMPYGGTLTPEEIALVRAWIDAGAPP